jgi:hypothetical protein
MQSQNKEVVMAAAVAIAPIFLKSSLGFKIFPRLQFFFSSIYIERWRMVATVILVFQNMGACVFICDLH